MKVIEISYTLGFTLNLGNYENLRPEITIKADADELQSIGSQFAAIQSQAKTELALSLWERATTELEYVPFLKVDEDRWASRARSNSSAFRWIDDLCPSVAADLLNGIVEDQRIEAEREAARKAAELAATEALLDIGATAQEVEATDDLPDDEAGEPDEEDEGVEEDFEDDCEDDSDLDDEEEYDEDEIDEPVSSASPMPPQSEVDAMNEHLGPEVTREILSMRAEPVSLSRAAEIADPTPEGVPNQGSN